MLLCFNYRIANSNNNSSGISTTLNPENTNVNENFSDNLTVNTLAEKTNFLSRANTDNTYNLETQDLIKRLSRPVIIQTGTWSSDDAEIREFFSYSELRSLYYSKVAPKDMALERMMFPHDLLNNSQYLTDCLTNIAYFKADVEINLRVQSTPYQQGILWLNMNPSPSALDFVRKESTEFRSSVTSFPGIELNLQSESREISLTVPFTSEFSYSQFVDPSSVAVPSNSFAQVSLYVLCPLKNGANESEGVAYTITANFTNIEIYGLCPNRYTVSAPSAFMAQAEDESASKKGIISDVSSTVSAVAAAAGEIPVLSTIAKPVKWAADAVTGIASFFGFSKPTNMNSTETYAHVPARGYNNFQGIDNSVKFAALPNNAIDPTRVSYDNLDPMAIEYIASRPWCSLRMAVTKEMGPGHVVQALTVHPTPLRNIGKRYTDQPDAFHSPDDLAFNYCGSIGYISSLFCYWRGTMIVNFKFAKTQFHNCRLLVQYVPYVNDTVPKARPIESCYSVIVDISSVDENGYKVKFPTVINNKWLQVGNHNDYQDQELDPTTIGGMVIISVLNPLTSPVTVASEINMVAWISWEDFELAYPGNFLGVPYVNPEYAPGSFEAQSSDGPTSDSSNLLTTMGESVVNTRPLSRRFTEYHSYVPEATMKPYIMYPLGMPIEPINNRQNLLELLSYVYRFYHGSIRYKFIFDPDAKDGTANAVLKAKTKYALTENGLASYPISSFSYDQLSFASSPTHSQNIRVNNIMECEIPYYSASENLVCGSKAHANDTFILPKPGLVLDQAPSKTLVAAGDDFSFNYLIGPPVYFRFPFRMIAKPPSGNI